MPVTILIPLLLACVLNHVAEDYLPNLWQVHKYQGFEAIQAMLLSWRQQKEKQLNSKIEGK